MISVVSCMEAASIAALHSPAAGTLLNKWNRVKIKHFISSLTLISSSVVFSAHPELQDTWRSLQTTWWRMWRTANASGPTTSSKVETFSRWFSYLLIQHRWGFDRVLCRLLRHLRSIFLLCNNDGSFEAETSKVWKLCHTLVPDSKVYVEENRSGSWCFGGKFPQNVTKPVMTCSETWSLMFTSLYALKSLKKRTICTWDRKRSYSKQKMVEYRKSCRQGAQKSFQIVLSVDVFLTSWHTCNHVYL